jgi:hypothetical protein
VIAAASKISAQFWLSEASLKFQKPKQQIPNKFQSAISNFPTDAVKLPSGPFGALVNGI